MGKTEESFARRRINMLLDENSFVELGALVTARSTNSNCTPEKTPSDGVITGYGLVNGHLVYVFAQDATILNGTLGEMHCRKIAEIYRKAAKVGAPVIAWLDSAGFRLQESMDALNGFGKIITEMNQASGRAPLFSVVTGNCGGGLAMIPALSDFSFMIENTGRLYINSPNTIPENYQEKLDQGKGEFQMSYSGIMDLVGEEQNIIDKIRSVICMIPGDWEDDIVGTDDLNRKLEGISEENYQVESLIAGIADQQIFCEVKEGYAKDIMTGFIRLGDMPIGVIANREQNKESRITADGLAKAADFVRFCDAFEISVLTVTDVDGFEPTMKEEKHLAREMARFSSALLEADVAKINLIPRKAYGSAYVLMNSKGMGADLCIGWENAKIGTMPKSISKKVLECELDDEIQIAASRGIVDLLISPADTRKYLISNFDMLDTKSECLWEKKHCTK